MTCNKRTIFIIIIEKWLPKTTAYVHDQIYFYCNGIKNAFVDSYQMTGGKKVSIKEIGFEVSLRDITSLNFKKQAHSTNYTIRIYFSTKLQLCNKGKKRSHQ